MRRYESWGRWPRASQTIVRLHSTSDDPFARARPPVLAYGLGRSYGDACLNDGGVLLDTRGLDRFLRLDDEAGVLTCEAGVSLDEILQLVQPHGFFLAVVPGTRNVTVGGAIANDVHGKNHHRAGTFGCHVDSFVLLRSSGERVRCSRSENAELFRATIGGLGLTGLILSATLRLRRVPSTWIRSESVPLRDLDEFFEASARADAESEFTVAWIDCLARGARTGRGILYRGNWAEAPADRARGERRRRLSVPIELPFSPLNRWTLGAFNAAYYAKARASSRVRTVRAAPFFFPLDSVEHWNRIYGLAGFHQFQCAIPAEPAPAAIREMLTSIAAAGEGSFLAVLKRFGDIASPGLLSFPRTGVTLALDFANRGERTVRLFRELHAMVKANGGRLYPAKDAHMSAEQFRAQHASVLPAFRAAIDPAFSSSFWRRVST